MPGILLDLGVGNLHHHDQSTKPTPPMSLSCEDSVKAVWAMRDSAARIDWSLSESETVSKEPFRLS